MAKSKITLSGVLNGIKKFGSVIKIIKALLAGFEAFQNELAKSGLDEQA